MSRIRSPSSSVFAWAKQRRRARAKNQCASVEAFAMHHHACAQRPCCKPCHWLDRGLPSRCSLALLLPVKQAALQSKGLHADRIVPVRACWPCQQACARKQAFCRLQNYLNACTNKPAHAALYGCLPEPRRAVAPTCCGAPMSGKQKRGMLPHAPPYHLSACNCGTSRNAACLTYGQSLPRQSPSSSLA